MLPCCTEAGDGGEQNTKQLSNKVPRFKSGPRCWTRYEALPIVTMHSEAERYSVAGGAVGRSCKPRAYGDGE